MPVWQIFLYLRGLDNPPAFADVVADRLFNVHVLAGLNGPDGAQGVPVIGRGCADDVDRLVVEDFPHVADELWLVAVLLGVRVYLLLSYCLVGVADVRHFHAVAVAEAI